MFFLFIILLPPRSTLFPYTTLFRSRLARFLLPLSRKSVARAGDPARPRAGPEPLAVHRCLYPAKNADKEAASQRGSGLEDRKSTRLNSSHTVISYAVFCLKKKKKKK